jgi:AcrR family transcriptional regulator
MTIGNLKEIMKKKIDNNEMKEKLINATLDLIEQQNGLHGVNLRQIAERAGCAHTNIYNYYQNFEDLLWDAIIRIGEIWSEFNADKYRDLTSLEEVVGQFANIQIDLAWERPGWYRCLWQEPLSGNLPEKVLEARRSQRSQLTQAFVKVSQNRLDQPRADRLFLLVFTFIHGSISLMINGRVVQSKQSAFKAQVLENVRFIINAFMKESGQESR